jgi:signal recognition particle receptor subunit beta
MPLDLGQVAGMKTKLFLYTVPGQVYYDSTRKLVLQGADGVSFIADSDPEPDERQHRVVQEPRAQPEGLRGRHPQDPARCIQYNKRDLPGALSVAELNAKVNPIGAPTFEAVAVKGEGVMQTLKGISKLVVDRLNEEYAPVKSAAPAAAARSGGPPGRRRRGARPRPPSAVTRRPRPPVRAPPPPAARPAPPPPPAARPAPPPPPSASRRPGARAEARPAAAAPRPREEGREGRPDLRHHPPAAARRRGAAWYTGALQDIKGSNSAASARQAK